MMTGIGEEQKRKEKAQRERKRTGGAEVAEQERDRATGKELSNQIGRVVKWSGLDAAGDVRKV